MLTTGSRDECGGDVRQWCWVWPTVCQAVAQVIAVILMSLAPGHLAAQVRCDTLMGQQPMNSCYALQTMHSLALLDTLVGELHKKLDSGVYQRLEPAQAAQLLVVQEKWKLYRDAHCKWQAQFAAGGSIQPTDYANCLNDLTWNRIDELKLDLCEGEGMTGACDASSRYDRKDE